MLVLYRKEEQEMAKLPCCQHKNLAGEKAWKLELGVPEPSGKRLRRGRKSAIRHGILPSAAET